MWQWELIKAVIVVVSLGIFIWGAWESYIDFHTYIEPGLKVKNKWDRIPPYIYCIKIFPYFATIGVCGNALWDNLLKIYNIIGKVLFGF